MSFSVRCEKTGVEYNGATLNSLFAQRRNVAPPVVPVDGPRDPAVQQRGPWSSSSHGDDDTDPRRVPRARGRYSQAVHRALHHPDGRRDLVGEPRGHDAGVPRAVLRAVLPQPRDAVGQRAPDVARGARAARASYVRRAHRAARSTGSARELTDPKRSTGNQDKRDVIEFGRTGCREEFARRDPGHPLGPGAAPARRAHERRRSGGPRARSRTRTTTPCCTSDDRGDAAGAQGLGRVELPHPRRTRASAVDGDLQHEHPAVDWTPRCSSASR